LVSSIAPQELAEAGSIFFTRPHLADQLHDAAEIGGRLAELFALLAAGKVQVVVNMVPLAQAAEAHRILRRDSGLKPQRLAGVDSTDFQEHFIAIGANVQGHGLQRPTTRHAGAHRRDEPAWYS
jgi:Zinc-binding dehydrogenase